MIELLVLCVLYALIWGIVVPIMEYICLGFVYLLLLGIFMYESLTRRDCRFIREKSFRLYHRLRHRT